jgi:hypothetical protein
MAAQPVEQPGTKFVLFLRPQNMEIYQEKPLHHLANGLRNLHPRLKNASTEKVLLRDAMRKTFMRADQQTKKLATRGTLRASIHENYMPAKSNRRTLSYSLLFANLLQATAASILQEKIREKYPP